MANGGYMMKDHGTWERYVPDPYPEGEWKGTAFARRVEDGKDWYAFIEENHFEPDTPKLRSAQAGLSSGLWRWMASGCFLSAVVSSSLRGKSAYRMKRRFLQSSCTGLLI